MISKIINRQLNMILPINGFVFGSNMSLYTIFKAGISGVVLGLLAVLFTGYCILYL